MFIRALAAVVVFAFPWSAAALPIVSLNPSATSVNAGESFTVDVQIDTGDFSIDGYDFSVLFDPAILSVSPAADGFFLAPAPDGTGIFFGGDASVPGTLDVVFDAVIGPPVTGTGVLATLHFTALAPGASAIAVASMMLSIFDELGAPFPDQDGDGYPDLLPVSVDAVTVNVGAGTTPVPEPGTLLLLATGLIGVRRFSRRRHG